MANQGGGGAVVAQIPTSFGHELRACLRCRLVKTYDQVGLNLQMHSTPIILLYISCWLNTQKIWKDIICYYYNLCIIVAVSGVRVWELPILSDGRRPWKSCRLHNPQFHWVCFPFDPPVFLGLNRNAWNKIKISFFWNLLQILTSILWIG